MTVSTGKHLIVVPMQMWGHTRTLCTLVARMVKLRNVTVAFFVITSFYDLVMAEVARELLPEEAYLSSRLRVVGLEHNIIDIMRTSVLEAAFEASYVKMLNDEPLTCARTGAQIVAHPVRVSAVILDSPSWRANTAIKMFLPDTFLSIRKHTSDTVKIYTWTPIATQVFFFHLTQDNMGAVEAEAERQGITFEQAAAQLAKVTGKVLHTPVTKPVHDYEIQPQAFPVELLGIGVKMSRIMGITDGFITFDAADYCPNTTKAIKEWFAQTSRKAYYAGPLIPQSKENVSDESHAQEVLAFLDRSLASHGEKSVIYVSFGSLFWPTDPKKLHAVLGVLMDRNIPFVMSEAAVLSKRLPKEVQEKVVQYGYGLVSKWVPQQALLDHPATGWCLSHGGHNSTLETIMAGVPTIVWPIIADQPLNATYLSEDLDVAYELIEVRNGTGACKIFRNGRVPIATIDAVKAEMGEILDRAFGEDGRRKRENLQRLRKTLQEAWSEHGVARREVEAFLDDL
ncbi:UDP-Glycosyltransferase/glycogen phosphorylase [Dichomitus squalens LYAD-421 SS1]|uniref:UDP-Glycosyltransferase/glycogen phosphorylase n=1 Tax=Dichomitus squalens (strain LYAD-421) TaxID=732165 RepID=R7SVQ2_DICSQ|nr:UDP-Glycosyltransferase/glycogen phosphorylase [Dichomitus squalens LYAD-421 SS1]EJF59052.1 UDP-Glycosyltransferase/glycogen phosphorylase [Dichomitus squalens LYAD-421 SS1]